VGPQLVYESTSAEKSALQCRKISFSMNLRSIVLQGSSSSRQLNCLVWHTHYCRCCHFHPICIHTHTYKSRKNTINRPLSLVSLLNGGHVAVCQTQLTTCFWKVGSSNLAKLDSLHTTCTLEPTSQHGNTRGLVVLRCLLLSKPPSRWRLLRAAHDCQTGRIATHCQKATEHQATKTTHFDTVQPAAKKQKAAKLAKTPYPLAVEDWHQADHSVHKVQDWHDWQSWQGWRSAYARRSTGNGNNHH